MRITAFRVEIMGRHSSQRIQPSFSIIPNSHTPLQSGLTQQLHIASHVHSHDRRLGRLSIPILDQIIGTARASPTSSSSSTHHQLTEMQDPIVIIG
jgi:hypothetical protein